jgi:hypothetical protein
VASPSLEVAVSILRAGADHTPRRAETKNRTFMQQLAAQRAGIMLSCRTRETAAKDISDPLDRFALRPGCGDPQAAILNRGYDYFFFFEVFFATFLVAALAVFFAFFAFLAMSSSVKKQAQ